MKRLTSLVLALLLALTMMVGAFAETADVTGEWYGELLGIQVTLTINADGTYKMDIAGMDSEEGVWEKNEDGNLVMDKGTEGEGLVTVTETGLSTEQDRADDHGNMQNGHVDKAQRNDSQRREAENERERDEQRRDDELPEIHVLHGNTSVQVPMRDTLRFLGETGNTCAGAAPRMPSVAVIIKGIAFLRLRIHVKMWYDKKK